MESHDGHKIFNIRALQSGNDQYHGYQYVPDHSIEIKWYI